MVILYIQVKEERTDPSSPRSTINKNKLEDLCPVDSFAIDAPETENQTIRCSDAAVDIQQAFLIIIRPVLFRRSNICLKVITKKL